jgi:hypothetical protein
MGGGQHPREACWQEGGDGNCCTWSKTRLKRPPTQLALHTHVLRPTRDGVLRAAPIRPVFRQTFHRTKPHQLSLMSMAELQKRRPLTAVTEVLEEDDLSVEGGSTVATAALPVPPWACRARVGADTVKTRILRRICPPQCSGIKYYISS